MSIRAARAAVNDAFAGIDGSAVVVITIVPLLNTIRRSINWIREPPFREWLLATGISFVESVILTDQSDAFQVGFDPNYADPRGRTYYAAVRYRFE